MLAIILFFWSLIAIGQAYGLWWIFALLLSALLGLLAPLGRIALFIWGGIALSALAVGQGWIVLFACMALLSIFFEH